jgi:DNA polymerase epsilon subunit 1
MLTTAPACTLLHFQQGFDKFTGAGAERLGWLINMHPTVFNDPESGQIRSGVDYYFLQEDGSRFKVGVLHLR